ncbi:MAG: LptF/LptG family permease, partial [Candidatus Cryptobacteroides sp.]
MKQFDLVPRKLDLYITKKFILTFFIALLLIIGIVIIFDISEKIDKFVSNEAPLRAIIFDYYLNFIPYFMNMFSPLFVFITVIFFTSKMASDSEIIAILSCGISFHRLMVPYMFSAAIIAAFSLCLNLFVIPDANKGRVEFEMKYIKKATSNTGRNVHYQISPGEFVYVESFSTWNNTAYRFTLEKIENNQLVSKLSAETAVWDSTFCGWKLKKYFIRDYTHGMEDHIRSGQQLDTVINLRIEDFYMKDKTIETLNYDELNTLIETQKMRGDANVKKALVQKHTRFS